MAGRLANQSSSSEVKTTGRIGSAPSATTTKTESLGRLSSQQLTSAPTPTPVPIAPVVSTPVKTPFDATNTGIFVNTVTGIPQAAKDLFFPTRGFTEQQIKESKPTLSQNIQAFPKVGVEIASGLGRLAGQFATLPRAPKPIDDFLKFVGTKIQDYTTPKTAQEAGALRLADVVTALPMGSIKIGKAAIEEIARIKDPAKISDILVREIKNITKAQADELAKPFALIDNVPDVEKAFNKLDFALNNADKGITTETKTIPKELPSPLSTSNLEPLAQEARKYKTAEEYIKGSGLNVESAPSKLKVAEDGKPISVTVYHGTPDARFAEEFNPNQKGYFKDAPNLTPDNTLWNELNGTTGGGFKTGKGVYDGLSFTDDARVAKSYADKPAFDSQNSVPMVLERTVTLNKPKVIDVAKGEWNISLEKTIEQAKKDGYDGIVFKNIKDNYHPWTTKNPSNNIIAFSADQIKTKSQLIDFYNQVTKKVDNQIPTTKSVSEADKLIAQGKIRVVSRNGNDVYQYKKGTDWKTAPNEMVAVERANVLPTTKKEVKPVNEKVAQLQYQIDKSKNILQNLPAKKLLPYVSKSTGQLPEVTGSKTKESLTGSGKIIKSGKFTKSGDQLLQELGFSSQEEAQKALDEYNGLKDRVDTYKNQLKNELQTAKTVEKVILPSKEKSIPPIAKSEGEVRSLEAQAKQIQREADPTFQEEFYSLPRIIEQTSTSVKDKVNLLDYIRTPDIVLTKIGFGPEVKALRTAYEGYLKELPKNIDKITGWSKRVPKESNERIFKWLDGQAIDLNPKEKEVALEIKSWLSEWANRLDLPDDNRIANYITHIFDKELLAKEFPEELAKLIADKIPGTVYNPFLEKRLGAKGYRQDTWAALDAYVKRATRKAYMDPVLEQIRAKTGSSLELSNIEESQFKYIQRYINNINMRPTELDKLIDNTVKNIFGYKFGQRPVTYITKTLRQMTFRGMLGLNPGSALRNLSQGINTYAVLGEKYTTLGYLKLFSKGAMQELKDSGILDANFIQDRQLSSTKKALEKIDKGLFYFFETAERINRGSAYFGAKAKALNSGKTEEQAIEYAKDIVRKTQFSFNSIDTPVFMGNDLVKTLTQFQTFTVKQIEFITEMAKDKNFAGLIRYAVAGILFTYTIGKLFGMEPSDLIPTFRVGVPPSLKFPWELGKAIFNAPDKYGNQPDINKKLENVSKSMIGLIPAGSQINKVIQGLKAINEGGSYDKAGNLQYTQGQSVPEKLQAVIFGKYVSPEAKQYFKQVEVSKAEKEQIKPIYDKVQSMVASGDEVGAKQLVDSLSDSDYEVYKKYKTQVKKEKTAEIRKKVLPQYLKIQELKADNKEDQALEIVNSMTDDEYDVYKKLKTEFDKEKALKLDDNKTVIDETSFFDSVLLVAKGMTIDPQTALKIVLTKEKIRRIDNDTIIMQRMSLDDSQKVKTEAGKNTPDYKLDHTIPLQLGGDNSGDNLKLVTTEEWNRYTEVENYLGSKLRAGKISKKEAQKLITDYKKGDISKEDIMK